MKHNDIVAFLDGTQTQVTTKRKKSRTFKLGKMGTALVVLAIVATVTTSAYLIWLTSQTKITGNIDIYGQEQVYLKYDGVNIPQFNNLTTMDVTELNPGDDILKPHWFNCSIGEFEVTFDTTHMPASTGIWEGVTFTVEDINGDPITAPFSVGNGYGESVKVYYHYEVDELFKSPGQQYPFELHFDVECVDTGY